MEWCPHHDPRPVSRITQVKNNRLKKTLSNAGLFPQPEAAAPAAGGRLKTAPTGSMAVFTQGPGAALTKGGGDAM